MIRSPQIPDITETDMPLLRKPLYQRSEGADEDRWRLAFDTETHRLFVEREKTRGDTRGSGYATETDELGVADYLGESGQGQHELMRLLGVLFEQRGEAPRP
jgi:hypothetical protein